jgi:deoxyribodipyrimidine photolyase-related protein
MKTLIPILGDQLSHGLSVLRHHEPATCVILMAEVWAEATSANHHKKKIVMVLSAMRHFAVELQKAGWTVDYIELDASENSQDLVSEIERAKRRHGVDHVMLTEPSEWRVKQALSAYDFVEDDRFLCSHAAFATWAKSRKEYRMEYFYRDMRRATGLLMDGEAPVGGQWNFDAENRKRAPKGMRFPPLPTLPPDVVTEEVVAMVARRFGHHFGGLDGFTFAVTAQDATLALDHFIQNCLPHFGATQDAMVQGEPFLHHAVLSAYINIGLLHPLVVCRAAENAWRNGLAPLEATEGFIRQIIGWREFIRGIYWLKMPDYAQSNDLQATLPLPDFYWTGKTDLNCIAQVVKQTREHGYAHHIQRLMITGNFALLAGLDPFAVHEWYLGVYIDAFEWVEMPNTIGMALHADGGVLGSKPYAASGNYINKMSNYCGSCIFDVKLRTGEMACPFNALYWNFIAQHYDRFSRNPRMAFPCKTYDKFSITEKENIANSASTFLQNLGSSGDWPSPRPIRPFDVS